MPPCVLEFLPHRPHHYEFTTTPYTHVKDAELVGVVFCVCGGEGRERTTGATSKRFFPSPFRWGGCRVLLLCIQPRRIMMGFVRIVWVKQAGADNLNSSTVAHTVELAVTALHVSGISIN